LSFMPGFWPDYFLHGSIYPYKYSTIYYQVD
jgi:hypothetical protein